MVKKSAIDWHVISVIRNMRIQNDISQAALATQLEVSNGFIGQVESPKYATKYSIEQLNKIAKIFGCSPKIFFPDTAL